MVYNLAVKSNIILGSYVCPVCHSHKVSVVKEHFRNNNTFNYSPDYPSDTDDVSLNAFDYHDTVDDFSEDNDLLVVACQRCGFLDIS